VSTYEFPPRLPRQASVVVPLAHCTGDGDMPYGGDLVYLDFFFSPAEEILDGGDLVRGDCECVGAEGVADQEAEIWLCLRGFCAGDTEGTRGGLQCQVSVVR
jgi:hypothetical protein